MVEVASRPLDYPQCPVSTTEQDLFHCDSVELFSYSGCSEQDSTHKGFKLLYGRESFFERLSLAAQRALASAWCAVTFSRTGYPNGIRSLSWAREDRDQRHRESQSCESNADPDSLPRMRSTQRVSGLWIGGQAEKSGFAAMSSQNQKKATKLSIALFLLHPESDDRFLAVKRPSDDDILPDVWGLPAVTCRIDELPEEAAVRAGKEKLNAVVMPVRTLGVKFADKGDHFLVLIDFEAKLVQGHPSVHSASTQRTRYVEQMWTDDLSILLLAASKGSLCSQIVLDSHDMEYRVHI